LDQACKLYYPDKHCAWYVSKGGLSSLIYYNKYRTKYRCLWFKSIKIKEIQYDHLSRSMIKFSVWHRTGSIRMVSDLTSRKEWYETGQLEQHYDHPRQNINDETLPYRLSQPAEIYYELNGLVRKLGFNPPIDNYPVLGQHYKNFITGKNGEKKISQLTLNANEVVEKNCDDLLINDDLDYFISFLTLAGACIQDTSY